MFMGPCIVRIFQYISNKMQRYTVYYIWKLLCMFRVVPPSIIRSAYNCIYSIWYLSHRYCYLPLAAGSSNGLTSTRCCRYSWLRSWWWVVVPPETCRAVSRYNKLCNAASCWIYIRILLRCTDPWTLNCHHSSSAPYSPSFIHHRRCIDYIWRVLQTNHIDSDNTRDQKEKLSKEF
jgi:hypothetical protein